MSTNFRIIRYANGTYGVHEATYSDDIPPGAKKGDGKTLIGLVRDAAAQLKADDVAGLKELFREARDAFLRPVIEEADLPKTGDQP